MKKILGIAVLLAFAPAALATVTVIDDFEVDEGHFTLQPTFSGSTVGLLASSTADRVETEAYAGIGSQQLDLLDNPNGSGWTLRHLSGGGSASGNVSITATGWIGYALKTETPGLTASIALDDPGTADRGNFIPVIADGEWHVYQWNMDDDTQWHGWVTGNGIIDGPTLTIDSIFLESSTEQDATVFIDSVMYNNDGMVPEPGTLALLALGGLAVIRRR